MLRAPNQRRGVFSVIFSAVYVLSFSLPLTRHRCTHTSNYNSSREKTTNIFRCGFLRFIRLLFTHLFSIYVSHICYDRLFEQYTHTRCTRYIGFIVSRCNPFVWAAVFFCRLHSAVLFVNILNHAAPFPLEIISVFFTFLHSRKKK